MNASEIILWLVGMGVILLGSYWCWMIYLMFTRPQVWLEWFMNRPFRWWGMQVTIVDPVRFRRLAMAYLAGSVLIAGATLGLWWYAGIK